MVYRALLCLLMVWGSTLGLTDASGAIIYESGTLGTTGVPLADILNGNVPDTSIDFSVYAGVRFQLDHPVITEQIGGHFVSGAADTFFGAIVSLDGENDTPDSFDFSTPDFLGATLVTFPVPSNEVFGNLHLSLDPGWYALVFGSGLFGATGDGGAVRNGNDIGNPSYIAAQPFSGAAGWVDISFSLPNNRYVITGRIVPEPTTTTMLSLIMLLTLTQKPRRKP